MWFRTHGEDYISEILSFHRRCGVPSGMLMRFWPPLQ